MKNLFMPYPYATEIEKLYIKAFWIFIAVAFWIFSPMAIIPSLGKVIECIPSLLKDDCLIVELQSSAVLYIYSLAITATLSAVVSYSTVIPVLQPIGGFFARWRALSLIGVLIVFTILTPNGFWLKVAILTFSMAPWLITSMNSIIAAIPRERYEYADTLRKSEWTMAYHVVIRGTLHQVIEAFRQVATMGIVMLPVAERLSRADGGVGAVLASLERFQKLDKIYAIDIIILCIVIGIDYAIRWFRGAICPHALIDEEGHK